MAWGIAGSAVLALGLAEAFNPAPWTFLLALILILGSFAFVGALLLTRLPNNPIGWILWASGICIGWAIAGVAFTTYSGDTCGGCLPGTVVIAFAANIALIPLIGAIAIFVPLLFPDGVLPSPAWRPLRWFAGAAILASTVVVALTPGEMSSGGNIVNPIGIDGFEGLSSPIGTASILALVTSVVLSFASVAWRFRHAGHAQRQQLRWFTYGALLMMICIVAGESGIGPLAEAGWIVMLGGLALMPIAIGIAVLRYRLYEIDRIVSRTIGYGLVTGVLVIVFASAVIAFEAVLAGLTATAGETLAVAASTLLAFALFAPLRRRVQRAVDRRFDRARFDAERTSAAFSERLRDEVDIAIVIADLDGTVRDALKPAMVGLWLRGSDRG